jgi:hypothetical protein
VYLGEQKSAGTYYQTGFHYSGLNDEIMVLLDMGPKPRTAL